MARVIAQQQRNFNRQVRLNNEVGEARNELKFTYGSIGITGISYRQVSFRIENVKKEQKLCERCATREKGEREKECLK